MGFPRVRVAPRLGRWTILVSAVLMVASAHTALAQGRAVTLYGRVTDASGAILPGATITVTSPNLIKGSGEHRDRRCGSVAHSEPALG